MADEEDMITIDQAAELITVSPMTVRRLMKRHELGPVFRGSHKMVRLRRSWVKAYIDRNSAGMDQPAVKAKASDDDTSPRPDATGNCTYYSPKVGCGMPHVCKWQTKDGKKGCRIGGKLRIDALSGRNA